jgi:hypothetical protein
LFQVQLKSEQAIIGLPVHFIKRNSTSKQLTIPEIFLFGSFWREQSKAVSPCLLSEPAVRISLPIAPVNRAPTADGETPRIMLTPPRRV